MTYIFNEYVLKNKMSFDAIFTESDLMHQDFESQILQKIVSYVGKTEDLLYREFDLNDSKKAKHINTLLVNRMLGVNTDRAEEFEKANIVIKTIRVQKKWLTKRKHVFSQNHYKGVC